MSADKQPPRSSVASSRPVGRRWLPPLGSRAETFGSWIAMGVVLVLLVLLGFGHSSRKGRIDQLERLLWQRGLNAGAAEGAVERSSPREHAEPKDASRRLAVTVERLATLMTELQLEQTQATALEQVVTRCIEEGHTLRAELSRDERREGIRAHEDACEQSMAEVVGAEIATRVRSEVMQKPASRGAGRAPR